MADSCVRAEQVSFRYPQDGHGLSAVSLDIRAGEAVLLAGPSGCGKSTLARCLAGLIPHLYRGRLTGQVWLGEMNTAQTPLWRLTERLGLVFQNPAAQMLTSSVDQEIILGLENLGLPRHEIRERLDEALDRFDLEPLRTRAPQTLSGGEQQKLALAAVMARRPSVLVLDEPLSMLDSTAGIELVMHLAELVRSGTTVVICEHRHERLRSLPGLRTVHLDPAARADAEGQEPGQAAFPAAPCSPFALEVSGLGVTLGGRPVLHELSFMAPGGQILAIVGRNGVGKTTLLRTLVDLQPHVGTVTVDGKRPDLSLVFQNPDLQLFNATVREEILYRIHRPDMRRYAWLIEMLGLRPYEATPPLLLSEGEKKRVALATALMRGCQHGILLDEPSLGQDAAHKARLVRMARALADAGQLVVMTTHDLSLAAHADRMVLLGSEGIVADGSPATLLNDPGPWARAELAVPAWVRPSLGEMAR